MKKLFVTIVAASIAASAFAQGTVNIGTGAGANTKFITTHTGAKTDGAAYWAQLFWANGTVTDDSGLAAAGSPINPRTGAAAGVLPSGEIRLDGVTPAGGVVTLQIRAWSSALGNAHDAAYAAWSSQGPDDSRLYGRSGLFQVDSANPLEVPTPTPPSIGAAFPGAVLNPVPEPSTIALGLIGGLGALLVFRRRK
jgi:hypothetical protein